jgi:hypothetical protein
MKKYILIILFITWTIKGFSQDARLNVDVNIPFPVGHNIIEKDYNGVIDVGMKYNFIEISKLRFGISLNTGLIKNSDVSVSTLMLKPRLNAELEILKITPSVGVGYSVFKYFMDNPSGQDKTNDGLNFNFGIRYRIISVIYINFSCDVIKFRTEKAISNNNYDNFKNFEIGLGISI